ncbi:conserved hypothetical protein [Vibrio chagasii]|nr:conserved hypothetical protein [Vibrio chagasii]
MSEYEVDVFIECESSSDCEYYPDKATTLNGTNGTVHEWTCPECYTKHTFEIEFEPEITNVKTSNP